MSSFGTVILIIPQGLFSQVKVLRIETALIAHNLVTSIVAYIAIALSSFQTGSLVYIAKTISCSILLASLIGCAPKEKSADEIANEAFALSRQYRAANNLAAAEKALEDGLMKTKSPPLMGGLAELLEQTQQWKKLEDYIEVNGSEMYPHNLQRAQATVASQHFNAKNWERAAKFSLKAADTDSTQRGTPEEQRSCPMVAPEYIRNAAAAHFNARNRLGVSEARSLLESLANEARCSKPEYQSEIYIQLDAVDKMVQVLLVLR